jgi:hypothetical protein
MACFTLKNPLSTAQSSFGRWKTLISLTKEEKKSVFFCVHQRPDSKMYSREKSE